MRTFAPRHDVPQTLWVLVPDESEWYQIDEAGYEELAD